MPRPRTPTVVAEVTGAAAKNPQRHRDRSKPKVGGLGCPPAMFTPEQVKAWASLADEFPWLCKSDRALVEVAAVFRARFWKDPEGMGVNALAQYRLCLSEMGGTPAARSKVSAPDDDQGDDPSAEFMH